MYRVIYTSFVFMFHFYNANLLFYPTLIIIYSLLCMLFTVVLDSDEYAGLYCKVTTLSLRGGILCD